MTGTALGQVRRRSQMGEVERRKRREGSGDLGGLGIEAVLNVP
jgi:hypothetical protein